jgi:hypothetical protein
VLNAGQRYLHAIANDRIIVYAQNGDLIGYLNFGFNAGVHDVRRNAVVVTENAEWIAQRPDRLDDPSATQSPVDVPAQAGVPASVDRQQSHTVKPAGPYRSREAQNRSSFTASSQNGANRNTDGKHVFRQIFPMSNERQNPVAFPSDWNRGVINHIGDNMPIVLGSIAGRASIEPMMSGS